MNRKKEELHRIVELTVSCCNTSQDGQDISIDDILGKSRRENLVMARCILVSQMIRQGYSVTTASKLLGRTTQTIRRMLVSNDRFLHSSRAYRIAIEEIRDKCRHFSESPNSSFGVSVTEG